jgi:hypothetical protein
VLFKLHCARKGYAGPLKADLSPITQHGFGNFLTPRGATNVFAGRTFRADGVGLWALA